MKEEAAYYLIRDWLLKLETGAQISKADKKGRFKAKVD
jgi:hypothetical protein